MTDGLGRVDPCPYSLQEGELPMTSAASDPAHDLVIQFVSELCACTADVSTEAASREALQAFCDALLPWMDPADAPMSPSAVFTLFEAFQISEAETVSVTFTPEGLALFHAWLRQRGIVPAQGSA